MKFKYYAFKIVILCIFIFILQIMFKGFSEIFILNELSYQEPWRFITSIFLHGDIVHLLYNGFALAMFGSILEKMIGGKKFLVVFFISGIFANLISVNYYGSSLGASGAIYGIIGALILIRPFMFVWAFGIPMPMLVAGIFWTIGDLAGLFIPSNIGHIAHLTGIVTGLVIGAFFRKSYKEIEEKKQIGNVILDETKMKKWEEDYLR